MAKKLKKAKRGAVIQQEPVVEPVVEPVMEVAQPQVQQLVLAELQHPSWLYLTSSP